MVETASCTSGPLLDNVYQRRDAVASYARFADYAPKCFTATLAALGRRNLLASKRLRILDLGVGCGAFAIPLMRALRVAGLTAQLDGFDSSEAMLTKGCRNAADADEQAVAFGYHDLEQGLPPERASCYDLIVTTFVLHYLHRWKELVAQIPATLCSGGGWLVSEANGDLPLMEDEGKRSSACGTVLAEFWREFHRQRSVIAPFVAELKPSEMAPVLDEAARIFGSSQSYQVGWTKSVAWRDVCSWIAAGTTAALGAGLAPTERHSLATHMGKWLRDLGIAPEMKIRLRMGVRFVLFHN